MSGEGKYGRLPKPKDRTHIALKVGAPTLVPVHDKASEWEEEGDILTAPMPKKPPPESTGSKIARVLSELAGQATASAHGMFRDEPPANPYASLTEDEKP